MGKVLTNALVKLFDNIIMSLLDERDERGGLPWTTAEYLSCDPSGSMSMMYHGQNCFCRKCKVYYQERFERKNKKNKKST